MKNKTTYNRDEFGNILVTVEDEHCFWITLQLANEKRCRRIGYVDKLLRRLIIERDREKHLFRKANAYGFNHYVLKVAKSFDVVCLSDGCGIYHIPVDIILSRGEFLFFKEQGFELQIFLPLSIIENYRKI